MISLIADRETAELEWAKRLETLSMIFYVSWGSEGI